MTSRRYHIIFTAVLFAILMWVSINMGYEYNLSMKVPVVVTDLPNKMALKHPVPRFLHTKMRSTGWRLASSLLSGGAECVLNIGSMKGQRTIFVNGELKDQIKVSAGIFPLDISPDTIVIELEPYKTKKIPLLLDVGMEFRDGYGLVGNMTVSPESVVIGGGVSKLSAIESWKTEPKVFRDLREPVSTDLPLETPDDQSIMVYQKSARISFEIQPFAEKTFSGVPVEARVAPVNREVIFIPPRIDVTVRGGIDRLASLAADDFRISVEYEILVAETTGIVQPRIDAPQGVRVIGRRPERLQFIIRKRL